MISVSGIHTSHAFRYHWWIWTFCGFNPPNRTKWRKYYAVYSILLNVTVTVIFTSTFIITFLLSENINDFCENFPVMITDVVLTIKYLNAFFMRHQLLKVNMILEKLDARARTAPEVKALQNGIASAHNFFIFIVSLYCCTLLTAQFIVYMSNDRTLMYQTWFPFDYKSTRTKFIIAFSYQVYGLTCQAIQNLVNDTYPQAYLAIVAAQLKALSLRILDIPSITACANQNEYGEEWVRLKEVNYKKLLNCIKDHKEIIELYITIQRIISRACFAQLICTGLGQCTLGVYILYVGLDYWKLLNVSFLFAAITLEVFILCYSGDRLCQESEHLSASIYCCNWPNQNRDFKKALHLFLIRSQGTNVIMAGNMIPVQLPTFVVVIKTAYSVFTVLSKMT